MAKKKILEIINSAARGGGVKHLWDLVNGLDRRKYEFEIVISPDGPYLEEFKKAGFTVHVVDMMSSRFQKEATAQILTVIKNTKPDLVHTHGTRAGFFLAKGIENLSDVPTLYTVHGLSYNKNAGLMKRVFYRQIERFICEKHTAVISVSEFDGKEMVENEVVSAEKLHIIRNGVELDKYLQMPLGRKEVEPLGTITRLAPQKGIYYLLKAHAFLRYKLDVDVQTVIVGDGYLRAKLEKRAEKLGISDLVIWAGSTDQPEKYYREFGTFVLPSIWEGLPLVLLEAMAAGVPVISTDTSGANDLLENGVDALIARRMNYRELAMNIKILTEDKDLRKELVKNARRKVQREYSLEKFLTATSSIYGELTS